MRDKKGKGEETAQKARRYHRFSLVLLGVVLVVFLLVSFLVELSPPALTALYVLLLAVAINAMWATMIVMVSRRGDDDSVQP